MASVLVLGLGLSTGTRAASAQAAPALTALDYFEIQQLVAKYARAIDTCSNNGYDYADLFAPDGYFAPAQNGKVGNKFQGRERLAEVSGGGSRGCKNVGWIRQGVKHLYVNHIITPTATGATGTVDMLMIGLGGDPNRIRHEGYYEDTYIAHEQRVALCVARASCARRWDHRAVGSGRSTSAACGTGGDANAGALTLAPGSRIPDPGSR